MKRICRVLVLGLVVLSLAPMASGQGVETILYAFKGSGDGAWPMGPVLEYGGALYGTTYKGGSAGYGTIFKLTPPAQGKTAWTKTTLYSFTGNTDVEARFSYMADNVILLGLFSDDDAQRTLRVVKTRNSAHDHRVRTLEIDERARYRPAHVLRSPLHCDQELESPCFGNVLRRARD